MNAPCPTTDELLQLVDGEATENRALQLRQHLSGCSVCREEVERQRQLLADVREPWRGASPPAALVAQLVDRVASSPPWTARRYAPGLIAAAATLACVALVSFWALRQPLESDGAFRARAAGTSAGLSRYVGVSMFRVDGGLQRVDSGTRVAADAAYVVTYRNLYGSEPVYLLCFAVDAAQAVHWLYPAYLDASDDPAASELAPTREHLPLAEAVVLDGVAPGPLRFVTIVTTQRLQVSSIEGLPLEQLRVEELRRRFGGAVIEEIAVDVARSP